MPLNLEQIIASSCLTDDGYEIKGIPGEDSLSREKF